MINGIYIIYIYKYYKFRAEELVNDGSYRFFGDGYAVLHYDTTTTYNKYLFSVSLNFKTFDERSLLFLVEGSQPVSRITYQIRNIKLQN